MEQAAHNNHIDNRDPRSVLTIKYKIYIVVLIIAMAVTRGYMQASAEKHTATKESIRNLENAKMQKEAEYDQVVKDLIVVRDINAQKGAVVTCLSTRGCSNLPESLKTVVPQTRAFLQLQKNEGEKMAFDQKKILANINEYLLRGANNQSNGTVTSIVFGNLAPVTDYENIVQVPIQLTIDFQDKNGLLSFVYNVENTISPQFPMLYKISSVNYDIVKYQENQTVSIELIGYMLK